MFTRLNERQLRQDSDRIADAFEQAGVESNERFARGLTRSHPKVVKAMDRQTDLTSNLNRQIAILNQLANETEPSQKAIAAQAERVAKAYRDQDRAIQATTASVKEANASNEARRRVFDDLNQSVADARMENERFARALPGTEKALARQADAANRVQREHARLVEMWRQGGFTAQQYNTQVNRITDALRNQDRAANDLRNTQDRLHQQSRVTFMGLIEGINNLGRSTAFLARGMGIVGLPVLIKTMMDMTKVVGEASQSFLLMPAALGAVGTAVGTLKLGFMGFSDTIEAIGDDEKFAEAIQKLSPNAQQAALSIKALVDGPLKELQVATQDALFAGVGETVWNLADAYAPAIQQLTTSVATSFNTMFQDVSGMLLQPGTQATLEGFFDNVSTFFSTLTPAARDFSQAILDIMAVGGQVLPLIAHDLATAASDFATFIREARTSGELRQWMMDGWEGMKSLLDGTWQLINVIKDLYDLFTSGSEVNTFANDMRVAHGITSLLNGDITQMKENLSLVDWESWGTRATNALGMFMPGMQMLDDSLRLWKDVIADIPEAFGVALNKTIDIINTFVTHINSAVEGSIFGKIVNLLGGDGVTDIPTIPNVNTDNWGNWEPWDKPTVPPNRFDDDRYTGGPPTLGENWNPEKWKNPTTGETMVMVPGTGWVPENDPRAKEGGSGNYPGQMSVPLPPPGVGDTPKYTAPREQWALDSVPLGAFEGEVPLVGGLPPGITGFQPPGPGGAPAGIASGAPSEEEIKRIAARHGLSVTSEDRPGDPGYHGQGMALDIGIPGMSTNDPRKRAFAEEVSRTFGPYLKELIYSDGSFAGNIGDGENVTGTGYYDSGTLADHQDHVHVAADWGNGAAMGAGYGNPSYGAGTARGGFQVDQRAVTEAQWEVDRRKADVEDARRRLLELRQDSTASEDQLLDAECAVVEKGQELQKAMWDLAEEQQGTYKEAEKSTQGLQNVFGELGVALDQDLGLSRGLPGLAENLIKFVGSLAAAPLQAQLATISAANPIQGGHGLLGIMGAQNIAATGNPLGLGGGFGGGGGGGPQWQQMMQNGMPMAMPGGVPEGLDPNVTRWAPMAAQVLQQLGMPAEWLGPMMKQIASESGGDPYAINNWDSNAAKGTPSQGLLQTIPSTFAANLPPGYAPDINNPASNMAAALTYMARTYGGPAGVWGIGQGYSQGGRVGSSDTVPAMLTPGEFVVNASSAGKFGPLLNHINGYADGGPVQYGGVEPYSNAAGGNAGIQSGGIIDMGLQAGGLALDAMAPGAGQAAQIGIKLANRAIQYAAQVGGIAASGLMETFLPFGMSELANNNWLTRLAGGLAGAGAALPNLAGKSATVDQMKEQGHPALNQPGMPGMVPGVPGQAGVLTAPPKISAMAGLGAQAATGGGNQVAVTYNNNGATEDRAGKDLTHQLSNMHMGGGNALAAGRGIMR